MQEAILGLLIFVVGVGGYLVMMRVGRVLGYRTVLAEMSEDLHRLDAEARAKCEAEGARAFENAVPMSANPYLPGNTDKPYEKFAGYWNQGYAATERTAGGK